jgi:predicted Rossmann fold flavoprotein
VPPFPIVVVGAGAAGLLAAIHAAGSGGGAPPAPKTATKPGPPSVLVLEGTRDGGRKILVSGGGRCNILPGELDEGRFVTDSSPNTMKKMLRSWPLAEQRRFFEETLGLALKLEPATGKLFPASNRARDVRDALVAEARRRGVEFRFETRVVAIEAAAGSDPAAAGGDASPPTEAEKETPRWILRTARGEAVAASAVVLATGGLSVPSTGSDGAGLTIAGGLGHEIHATYAALTPLSDANATFAALAGVSLDVLLEAPGGKKPLRAEGGFLFTHRGYSGPAVLDVSHLAVRSVEGGRVRALPASSSSSGRSDAGRTRQKIFVQWTALGREEWERELAPRRASTGGALRAHLPARLAEALLWAAGVSGERSLAELRRDERLRLLDALVRFELPWTGHEGYRTAEVTGGGVGLSEIDPRTMESRRAPGLFLCGEMLDAFGPIGGYNFLWAWATGRAAGLGAAASVTGDAPAIVSAHRVETAPMPGR